MEHEFKVGDIVRLKGGSPDLTVIAIGPESVRVACYEEGFAHFNGTYYHKDVELLAGTHTPEAEPQARKATKSKKAKKSDDAAAE